MYTALFCMNQGLRPYQEDCILINGEVFQKNIMDCPEERQIEDTQAVFAVCDGVGGLSAGDEASRFVCQRLKDRLSFSVKGVVDGLHSIQKEFEKDGPVWSGTTVAGVLLKGRNALVFNVGDSRVYKYTPDGLIYLSHDHSYVQELVDRGLILPEEAFYHPSKNILEFGIGDAFSDLWAEGKRPFVKKDFLNEDEAYLISTDGLHDYMPDSEIHYYLYPDPFENFGRLISQLEKVKSDNYAIVLVRA
ncbi:PP2C family protein-serine/threonine phosphatase [Persephonella sp.]